MPCTKMSVVAQRVDIEANVMAVEIALRTSFTQ